MVYRFSWLAGITAIVFAFTGLSGLLRPTQEGTRWEYVVIAAVVLGATITWTALTYRAHPIIVVVLNLVALAIAISRVAAPETMNSLIPTGQTFTTVMDELNRAFTLIHTGIEPVQPIAGIVVVVTVVFWVTGVLLAWGLLRGHPYVALIPPLVLALQFATMDRSRTGLGRIIVFLAVVGGSIVAVTTDERDQSAGRMSGGTRRPTALSKLAPSAAGLLGVTLVFSVIGTGFMNGLVPYDGILPWRSATGLTSDFYGGIAYNPFIGIKQSLVSQSDTPVFLAHITGDVPGDQVYFRLVTMEAYNGGQFFADKPTVVNLDTRPWELGGNVFTGPVDQVETDIQIERLRMDWLPASYVPTSFSASADILETTRVRQSDGSLRLEGDLSYEGMQYTINSSIPHPDIAVLETDEDGNLSPAFEFAASEQNLPDPVEAQVREDPVGVDAYLDLPEDLDPAIQKLARQRTANLTTNYEIGLALESWFHSDAFAYSTNIEPGHGATDLAEWLLDDQSPNYHIGYCENFATAMAVMARTLGVPSRVVLGFTPGEPTGQEDVYVVRDRNAHAWVELWIPSQGWMRFDPTPRSDGINPTTYSEAEAELGFDLTAYLDVPDSEPITVQNSGLPLPQLPNDIDLPQFGGSNDVGSGGGIHLPGWFGAALPIVLLIVLAAGGIPMIKWWQRRTRMRRLESGDITAAWEDVVARLTDLGDAPSPANTPRQIADSVDSAMVPLAVVYGRAVYGPEATVSPENVATASASLDATRARLATRHSVPQRVIAAYRPASIIPPGARRLLDKAKVNGRNGNRRNGS
ncbi:MAG: transglutaminaseTgpA domain-containing protein [Acidimicrobiia bacterium]